MQSTSKLLVTLILLLVTATGAAAATLVSPPLVPGGTNFLDCYLVNVGTKPRPVTIQVFNDLQCDPCSDWNRDVIVPLIGGPVRAGDVQMIFHHFPISAESGFFLGSYAAVAAAKQDDEWQFIELFFANQEEAKKRGATQDFLNDVARGILNLNVEQWQNDMNDRSGIEQTLNDDETLAADRHLPAEPAVVVGGPNGTRQLIESPSLADVQAAIAEVS